MFHSLGPMFPSGSISVTPQASLSNPQASSGEEERQTDWGVWEKEPGLQLSSCSTLPWPECLYLAALSNLRKVCSCPAVQWLMVSLSDPEVNVPSKPPWSMILIQSFLSAISVYCFDLHLLTFQLVANPDKAEMLWYCPWNLKFIYEDYFLGKSLDHITLNVL